MLQFFNDNFGRYLVEQSGDPVADARRALSSGHRMKKPGIPQRIASGWAVVRPGTSTMQFQLAAEGIAYSTQTRYEAFLAELDNWDRTPRMFIEFAKRPVPVDNLFRTFDLRQVRICSPTGVETFDFTKPPEKDGCKTHKVLWKLKTGGK
ncbi:MAG: hypothetical protein M0P95_13720 [Sulfuritalea sp.]|jgi:hypothetical protein|nr:hypothetical protein [Sulfuritalea sp.]